MTNRAVTLIVSRSQDTREGETDSLLELLPDGSRVACQCEGHSVVDWVQSPVLAGGEGDSTCQTVPCHDDPPASCQLVEGGDVPPALPQAEGSTRPRWLLPLLLAPSQEIVLQEEKK